MHNTIDSADGVQVYPVGRAITLSFCRFRNLSFSFSDTHMSCVSTEDYMTILGGPVVIKLLAT